MLKTFLISFRLRATYKANSFIWVLKSLPLIKKLLPSSLYASSGLKTFANVVSGIREFISAFLGKAIYLALVWYLTITMKTTGADSFAHILLFLTVVGGLMNTQIFDPTKDKFYAMFIMRLDAKSYTVTNYLYFLLKMFAGFLVFTPLVSILTKSSPLTSIAVPLYVVSVKLCFSAWSLKKSRNSPETVNENKLKPITWISVAALLAAGIAPPYFGFALSETVLWIFALVLLTPAGFALRYVLRFDSYREIYKELLKPDQIIPAAGKSAQGAAQQKLMQKKITADLTQTSNKSGYKYFNEIFMKRHSKLLTKAAKRIAEGAALFFAASAAALFIFPSAGPDVNGILLTYLPYFLFVMYLVNRGKGITQAMFMNCDHSMLTYRFYRQPRALLSLFVERLKYIILINLLPATVIAAGLPLLLYISGGTEQPLNYFLLFISIIAMSIFFSVHSIVMYYLLQPYNVNLESKSAAYSIVNSVTYIICYSAIRVKMPTLIFGSVISAFCVIYAAVAVILAYRLAPKTFKLRN